MNKNKYINVKEFLKFDKEDVLIVHKSLLSETTEDKLTNILLVNSCVSIPSKQKLFIIQKLLSYPKFIRKIIAEQLLKIYE